MPFCVSGERECGDKLLVHKSNGQEKAKTSTFDYSDDTGVGKKIRVRTVPG